MLCVAQRVFAQAPLDPPREVKLAEGVYALHNPRANESWPQGNTLVVIGSRSVLVVDADYLPGTARADIALIRSLTRLPVRFLVNTHWHYDHTNGNAVYRDSFPDIQIIAHPATRRLIEDNTPRYVASVLAPDSPVRKSVLNSRTQLLDSTVLADSAQKALYERRLAQRELELRELGTVRAEPPTTPVTGTLTLDLGGRTVRIQHLGRGNTPGDVVVFLPRERILASGDLIVSPVPYAYNSSPASWVGVLDELIALKPAIIMPGHGEIQRGNDYLLGLRAMMADVVERVRAAYRAGRSADDARKSIDFEPWRRRYAGTDPFLTQVFDGSIQAALVDRAFAEAQGAN